MEPIAPVEAATQLIDIAYALAALVGLVMPLANVIMSTLRSKRRFGLAKWLVIFINFLAGNWGKNPNSPLY